MDGEVKAQLPQVEDCPGSQPGDGVPWTNFSVNNLLEKDFNESWAAGAKNTDWDIEGGNNLGDEWQPVLAPQPTVRKASARVLLKHCAMVLASIALWVLFFILTLPTSEVSLTAGFTRNNIILQPAEAAQILATTADVFHVAGLAYNPALGESFELAAYHRDAFVNTTANIEDSATFAMLSPQIRSVVGAQLDETRRLTTAIYNDVCGLYILALLLRSPLWLNKYDQPLITGVREVDANNLCLLTKDAMGLARAGTQMVSDLKRNLADFDSAVGDFCKPLSPIAGLCDGDGYLVESYAEGFGNATEVLGKVLKYGETMLWAVVSGLEGCRKA